MNARRSGFTLIELLVVVALIAVMLAIAVPSFASFISNYRATGAVNELLQGVTLTRAQALQRGRRVTMLPNRSDGTPGVTGSWKYGWTVFVDLDGNQLLDGADVMIFKHPELPTSIVATAAVGGSGFTSPFGNANYVAFDGSGYPRTTTGAQLSGGIVLTDTTGSASNIRTLCLANLGRPRVVKGVDSCTSG